MTRPGKTAPKIRILRRFFSALNNLYRLGIKSRQRSKYGVLRRPQFMSRNRRQQHI